MGKITEKYIQEIVELAEGTPVKRLHVEELDAEDYVPRQVRQERHFSSVHNLQPVSRFLAERGVVELLKPEDTLALFCELHWCAQRLDELAEQAKAREIPVRQARGKLIRAREWVSRMEAAEEELFIANRRLIVNCVKPFYWVGDVWIQDFLQEGARALSNAIRKFDYTRGTPFFSYAQISIKNRMRNYFRDHVRAGSLAIRPTEEMKKVKQMLDTWRAQHSSDPPLSILAKMVDLDEDKVRRMMPMIRQWERMPAPPASLDAMLGETTSNLHELLEDTRAESGPESTTRSEVWEAIARLPERSQKILEMRFIQGHTLEETGQQIGLTRARIKQIQDEAVRKIREMLNE